LPVEESQRFAASIPDARFVMTEGEGVLGDPAEGLAAIDSFLAGVPDAAFPQDRQGPDLPATEDSVHLDPLTAREKEVLRLIAQGRSNLQIADELVLSVRTVERHITNLYAKIGAHGKAEATAYALRHGLD
jgi:DNA-binding NarL/FixJ family response regulator